MDRDREGRITVEGDPVKQYGVSYRGVIVGSYDTAKKALEEHEKHNRLIRPVIDRKGQGRYTFRDGMKEITIIDLRCVAKNES